MIYGLWVGYVPHEKKDLVIVNISCTENRLRNFMTCCWYNTEYFHLIFLYVMQRVHYDICIVWKFCIKDELVVFNFLTNQKKKLYAFFYNFWTIYVVIFNVSYSGKCIKCRASYFLVNKKYITREVSANASSVLHNTLS